MPVKPDDVQQQFSLVLGREPRESELADLTRFLDTNYVDLSAEEIGQILKSMPEARERDLQRYGKLYEEQLTRVDEGLLGEASEFLRGEYTRLGRPETSGYASSLTRAATELGRERRAVLADFYGRGYGGIYGQIGAQGLQTRERGIQSLERRTELAREKEIYFQQQSDFNAYLNAQNRRQRSQALLSAGLGLGGALLGAGIGGSLAGGAAGGLTAGQGAFLGATIGAGTGRFGAFAQ